MEPSPTNRNLQENKDMQMVDGNNFRDETKKQIISSPQMTISMKKDRLVVSQLLQETEDIHGQEESLHMQELQKEIKRKIFQTNLNDRRTLGGLIGTAVLGIIGLAVGLNIIGIVIGGILGAFLGVYAGKRIKENALRKKKLLHINIHIIRMAALVQHLLDYNIKTVTPQEIRRLMRLLLSDSKMLILLTTKLRKQEHQQVIKIQRRLLKCLCKPKYLLILKEIYWVVKEWCKNSQNQIGRWKEQEIEVSSLAFSFLRPLTRIMMVNRRLLSQQQNILESKMQGLLLSVQIIELRQKYPQFTLQQEDAEEEFLESIYKEVELSQLKALMEDQVVQEILQEDQKKEQEKILQHGGVGLIGQNKDNEDVQQEENNVERLKGQENNNILDKDNTKLIVLLDNHGNNNNNNVGNSPGKQSKNVGQRQQRLIDLIQFASQQRQSEFVEIELAGNIKLIDNKNKEETKAHSEDEKSQQNSNNQTIEKNSKNGSNKQQQQALRSLLWFGPEDCTQLRPQHLPPNNLNYLQQSQKEASQGEVQATFRPNKEEFKPEFEQYGYVQQKQLGNHLEDEELAAQTFSSLDHKTHGISNSQKDNSLRKENNSSKIIEEKKQHLVISEKNNFQSNADAANYQTNIEEGISHTKVLQTLEMKSNFAQDSFKKATQKEKQSNQNHDRSEISKGFVQKHITSNSPRKSCIVINVEEINAAIEELKSDSQSLNMQHSYPKHNSDSQLKDSQASFKRAKHAGLLLKMNSSDSVLSSETPVTSSKNVVKHPLVNSDQDNENSPSKDKRSLFVPSQSSLNKELTVNLVQNKNHGNQENSLKEQVEPQLAEIKIQQDQGKTNDICIEQCMDILKEVDVAPKLTENVEVDRIRQQKINSNSQSQESYPKGNIQEFSPINYYSKDDQTQVDHITINVLNISAGSRKNNSDSENKETNAICQLDPEIEGKFIRLKELDQENPEKFWEKVIEKGTIKIYKRQIPNNPSVMVRAEAEVQDCTKQEIFDQIYYAQLRTKWDKVTLGFSVIETLGHMQDIIYFYIDPGFGVTKRDFLQKRAVRKDYPFPGDITIIFFSIDHPSFPEKKGWIRAISHIAAYIIRPIEGSNNTHLSIITQSDVKGQIPKYIVNFLAARAPAKWIESMRKGIQDHRKQIKNK